MKRILAVTFIIVAILCMSVGLMACEPKTMYFVPEILSDIDGITIEHVTNVEKDYYLPIETSERYSHDEFVQNQLFSSAYLINDSGNQLVGWITNNFGTHIKGDKVEYGVYADKSNGNGLQFIGGCDIRIYLEKQDENVFEKFKITSNYGNVDFVDKFDCMDANNNATDYICGYYQLNLSNVDPASVDKIVITLSLN